MRFWAVLLLLLLPLQWVSAAVDRYSPHPASEAAHAQLAGAEDSDHGAEHDCPQCHVLCIKALFPHDLPRLRPHSLVFLSRHSQAPPSAVLATPERPPQATSPDHTRPA